MRVGARCALALGVLAVMTLAQPAWPAVAHAFLVRTVPQAGERLLGSPSEIVLQFSEPVVRDSPAVSVRTATGAEVPVGSIAPYGSGNEVRVSLPPVGQAIYIVSWSVLAADGHTTAGEFAFAVGTSTDQLPTASESLAGAIAWPDALASALFLAGLTLGIGGLASETWVWGPIARRRGLPVPLAPIAPALVVAVAGAGLQLGLVAVSQGAGAPGDVAGPWPQLLLARPGLLAAIELGLVGYGLWVLRLRRLRAWSLLPLLGGAAAAAVRGHAGASPDWWAAPANTVHLGLAGFWVGALAQQVLMLPRLKDVAWHGAASEAARRYAGFALVAVPPLLVAGAATAVAEFTSPAELIQTTYGQVLLAKLLFVVSALGLALAARLRGLGRAFGPPRPRVLHRLVSLEGSALFTVVGLSAVLASTAPPRELTTGATDLLGPPPLQGPVLRQAALAGTYALYLAAAEGELQLRVLAPGGDPASDARVQVDGRGPAGEALDLFPRSCGRGCWSMAFAWQPGDTRLTIGVSGTEWAGGTAEFRVAWPLADEDPALLADVLRSMREQPQVQLTEQVSSGPGATALPHTFALTGPQFVDDEPYASGEPSDVRVLPGEPDERVLTLFIPGSAIWVRLQIDAQDRLSRETIVDPGHQIERSFAYGPAAESPATDRP